ncbi:hypothetical protein FOS14_23460 [Skermania sp. ID1734]|nr:hypothetical protein FOS14_23460 [Skermania sp. ID1734]
MSGPARTATLAGEGVARRGLLGVDPLLAGVWSLAAALAVLCWWSVQGWAGAVAGVLVGAAVAATTVSWDGRESWAQRRLHTIREWSRRRNGEHVFWSVTDRGERSGVPAPDYDPGADPAWCRPVFCGRVEPLPLAGTGFDPLFVLRHSNPGDRFAYLSVVLAVQGVQSGLGSDADYAAAWREWGWVQAELAKRSSFIRGLQLLHRSVPADITPHVRWYRDKLAPDEDGRLEMLVANYDQLLTEIAPLAEEHRTFVVVKVPLTPEFHAEAATRDEFGGTRRVEVGWASVVKDELERLVRLLDGAGWGPVHVLGERRTAALIRALQNPDYALDDDRDVDWESCWQSYIGGADAVVVAGKWHTRCGQVPPGAIQGETLGPLWLQPLLVGVEADEGREDLARASTIRTISVRIDFVPDAKARVEAVKDVTQDAATRHRHRQKGKISDGTAEVMESASARRRDDLAPGRGVAGSAYAMSVSVTGRDSEDLRRACLRVEQAAGSSAIGGIDWHTDRHDTAQVQTLPLCRGMAGVKHARTN